MFDVFVLYGLCNFYCTALLCYLVLWPQSWINSTNSSMVPETFYSRESRLISRATRAALIEGDNSRTRVCYQLFLLSSSIVSVTTECCSSCVVCVLFTSVMLLLVHRWSDASCCKHLFDVIRVYMWVQNAAWSVIHAVFKSKLKTFLFSQAYSLSSSHSY